MVSDEQLKLLRRGSEVWNAWRRNHPHIQPNLIKADLTGARLIRANLDGADLIWANLTRADLSGARLIQANLAGADLARANLTGANLIRANLIRANLIRADLARADLARANLTGANLIRAKLTRATLNQANLDGANLAETKLNEANLAEANLAEANLTEANLTRAGLSGARLIQANLAGATLNQADLTGADLTGANLSGANFIRADLIQTNLDGAKLFLTVLFETVLADLDLSNCKGLESCRHLGPSIIDYRTLQRSGSLPLAFLRGVGLPDNLIDYLPSLLNQPIQFYSCFISYSSKDQAFVERLHADLQAQNVRCWFAPHDMRIGDKFRTRIDEVIRVHQKLLLVLSENSIVSSWVEKEVETAFEREQEIGSTVLFPIRLDAMVMDRKTGWAADIKRTRHIGDFTGWKEHDAYSKGLERLLRDLKVEAGGSTGQQPK